MLDMIGRISEVQERLAGSRYRNVNPQLKQALTYSVVSSDNYRERLD